jgi:pilus assembly protein Flp/PilA
MLSYLQRLVHGRRTDEKGASAVEYGLLVAAIAALIALVVFGFGSVVKGVFKDTCGKIGASSAPSGYNAATSCG